MTFRTFLHQNLRWLAGGLLLTFFSSIGQTFFIASFAGQIRDGFALSHGGFGLVYMLATLASAATLILLGPVVDRYRISRIAMLVISALAIAALSMALAQGLVMLLLSLYLLRLFGQGMMSHVAITAMGRWYCTERGRAISITSIGHQLGEGLLPLLIVGLLSFGNWRMVWVLSAVVLLLIALPLTTALLRVPRVPNSLEQAQLERGPQWTRAQAIRDAPFWVVASGVLAPSFIGTSIFFHQVHIAATKGWAANVIASSFVVLSITTISFGLIAGHLVDRYSARQLLPLFLLPLSIGCVVLATVDHAGAMLVFMFLLGSTYGISNAVFGAIWPEVYGVRHLGSIRALVSAAMVFASAMGPGLTGWLLDRGIALDQQLLAMSAYCVVSMMVLFPVVRVLGRRAGFVQVGSEPG